MKFLLLGVIRLYQTCCPNRFRRTCLYKESCSRYVYRVTKRYGFCKGVFALRYRMANCAPGYKLYRIEAKEVIITRKMELIQTHEIAPDLLNQ